MRRVDPREAFGPPVPVRCIRCAWRSRRSSVLCDLHDGLCSCSGMKLQLWLRRLGLVVVTAAMDMAIDDDEQEEARPLLCAVTTIHEVGDAWGEPGRALYTYSHEDTRDPARIERRHADICRRLLDGEGIAVKAAAAGVDNRRVGRWRRCWASTAGMTGTMMEGRRRDCG